MGQHIGIPTTETDYSVLKLHRSFNFEKSGGECLILIMSATFMLGFQHSLRRVFFVFFLVRIFFLCECYVVVIKDSGCEGRFLF